MVPNRESLTIFRTVPPTTTSGARCEVEFRCYDEQNIRTAAYALSRLGYEVSVAADGRDALDFVQRNEVDLVLTDLRMPKQWSLTTRRIETNLSGGARHCVDGSRGCGFGC